jgi:hypothetical protein
MIVRKEKPKAMTSAEKAKELTDKYGLSVADKIVNGMLSELQELRWDQARIDYYLDVKNGIKAIALARVQKK